MKAPEGAKGLSKGYFMFDVLDYILFFGCIIIFLFAANYSLGQLAEEENNYRGF